MSGMQPVVQNTNNTIKHTNIHSQSNTINTIKHIQTHSSLYWTHSSTLLHIRTPKHIPTHSNTFDHIEANIYSNIYSNKYISSNTTDSDTFKHRFQHLPTQILEYRFQSQIFACINKICGDVHKRFQQTHIFQHNRFWHSNTHSNIFQRTHLPTDFNHKSLHIHKEDLWWCPHNKIRFPHIVCISVQI